MPTNTLTPAPGSALRKTTEIDPYELVRVLRAMQDDVNSLFEVLHAFSEVATEHLGAAQESKRPGEPTILY